MKSKNNEALHNAMNHYFDEMKAKVSEDKHEFMQKSFDTHMEQIADYCVENYVNKGELAEDFIKGLHKILYPDGYFIDRIYPDGRRVKMIPGEYKDEDNGAPSVVNIGYTNAFCPVDQVHEIMIDLIEKFNKNIKNSSNKKDLIWWFCLDFSRIHPFGDGNGRVAVILLDLLLINNGIEPVNLHYYKEKDYDGIRKTGELTMINKDLKYMYDFIEKNK